MEKEKLITKTTEYQIGFIDGENKVRKELQSKIMKEIDEWWNNQPELRTEKSINELKQNLNKLFEGKE